MLNSLHLPRLSYRGKLEAERGLMAYATKRRRTHISQGSSLRNVLSGLGLNLGRKRTPRPYTASPTPSSLTSAEAPSQSSRSSSNTLPTLGGRFGNYTCLSCSISLAPLGTILHLSSRSGLIRTRNSLSALNLLTMFETFPRSTPEHSMCICGVGGGNNA